MGISYGPWHVRVRLEPGITRSVPMLWREVYVVGLQPDDQLFADGRQLQVDAGQIHLQVWPASMNWKRGPVTMPIAEQAGATLRLPAVMRLGNVPPEVVCRTGNAAQSIWVLKEPIAVVADRDALLTCRRGAYVARPARGARLQPGQVLDIQFHEQDLTLDPDWARFLGRAVLRKWTGTAAWTGGTAVLVAGVAFGIATGYESAGDGAVASYNTATDPVAVQRLRGEGTASYASAATWRNVSIAAGLTGGALLALAVTVLVTKPAIAEPDWRGAADSVSSAGQP